MELLRLGQGDGQNAQGSKAQQALPRQGLGLPGLPRAPPWRSLLQLVASSAFSCSVRALFVRAVTAERPITASPSWLLPRGKKQLPVISSNT